jgi:hypothetical protein
VSVRFADAGDISSIAKSIAGTFNTRLWHWILEPAGVGDAALTAFAAAIVKGVMADGVVLLHDSGQAIGGFSNHAKSSHPSSSAKPRTQIGAWSYPRSWPKECQERLYEARRAISIIVPSFEHMRVEFGVTRVTLPNDLWDEWLSYVGESPMVTLRENGDASEEALGHRYFVPIAETTVADIPIRTWVRRLTYR